MSKQNKIFRETRDPAAILCELAASNPEFGGSYTDIARAIDVNPSDEAIILAFDAYEVTWNKTSGLTPIADYYAEREALAAALLREGWVPE